MEKDVYVDEEMEREWAETEMEMEKAWKEFYGWLAGTYLEAWEGGMKDDCRD